MRSPASYTPRPAADGPRRHAVVERVALATLIVTVVALAVLVVSIQRTIGEETRHSDAYVRIASIYQDARFWVGQEESLERKYRLEPSSAVLRLHDQAERNLTTDLHRVQVLTGSPTATRLISRLLANNREYADATRQMFAAAATGSRRLVTYFDHFATDPLFSSVETAVYGQAAASSAVALSRSAALRRDEARASQIGVVALVLTLILLASFGVVNRRGRRVQRAARAVELRRLRQLVVTDPLTGLRNHRAFQEDLAQELHRTGRTGIPVSLIVLDADGLKAINDTRGHQAGDEALRGLAQTIAMTPRVTDRAYRVGGDEFAIILHNTGAWAAFELAQRLHASLASREDGEGVQATMGVAEALSFRTKEEIIREADLALVNAKLFDQHVVLYTHEMEPLEELSPEAEDERQTRTLAKALALAVDSKDSYTRSHSQTVATLCAVIAAELGFFDDARLKRIRLAGLLHDVGKIGIPDSILKKPAKLTCDEFEEMKTHSVLGESIILAAEMPTEAHWVRHHHERIDGGGYPDVLAGEDIPLESRIIHVADAFEAMTSDRPYRVAPGEEFAIQELQRHAGTQFDADVVDALLRVIRTSKHGDPRIQRGSLIA